MKRKILYPVLAGIIAVSLIAGCSSGKNSGGTRGHNDSLSATSGASPDMYAASAGAEMAYDAEFGFAEDVMLDNGGAAITGAGAGGNISNDVTVDPAQGRLLIRTVSISAETQDIMSVKYDLESQIKALGGYVENSTMTGTGNARDLRTMYYTVRVPADQLDNLVATVGNSCTVISSSENSTDVTLEYVDTKARVESLRVEYNQLTKLLEQAEDLDTIIVLQNRMTEVRYQIESAESRIRVLENQVLYATLNLTVKEVLEETVVEEAHVVTFGERIGDQFADTWENTVEFFQDLLLVTIACLPGIIFLAIVTAVVLIIVFSARNKRRKRRAKALAEKEAAAKKAEKEAKENEKTTDNNADKKAETKDEGRE